jgi:predicted AAA+ superfamily ATPase
MDLKYRYLNDKLDIKKTNFAAIAIVGPRRSGKSTLAQKLLGDSGLKAIKPHFFSFDTPQDRDQFLRDPVFFMQALKYPVVIDEVQNIPEIFPYIKSAIDQTPATKEIKFILTGSQQYSMMKGLTESLAGRILIRELLPFSQFEIDSYPAIEAKERIRALWNAKPIDHLTNKDQTLVTRILAGGFPPIIQMHSNEERLDWMGSYVQTYIERDLRSLSAIQDLSLFNRFISLIAGRSGRIINFSEIGKELGINYKTAQHYVSLLETGFLWRSLSPYHRNTEKRITKSSKGILMDSGLLCYLVGIYNKTALENTPLLGAITESFFIAEFIKICTSLNFIIQTYYFDEAKKYEVDLIVEHNGEVFLFEVKYTASIQKSFLTGFEKFKSAYPKTKVKACYLVTQNLNVEQIAPNVWSIPFNYFWN